MAYIHKSRGDKIGILGTPFCTQVKKIGFDGPSYHHALFFSVIIIGWDETTVEKGRVRETCININQTHVCVVAAITSERNCPIMGKIP